MWARVARFEGDPADVNARLERLRSALDAGAFASELADTKLLMLVDRESGGMIGVTLFDSEEAMRRGDEALNNMTPGASERRTSVEFFEVPVETVTG